jgi:hypothetical protein
VLGFGVTHLVKYWQVTFQKKFNHLYVIRLSKYMPNLVAGALAIFLGVCMLPGCSLGITFHAFTLFRV